MFPVIAMQIFDLKNSVIAIKQYLVMISNLYLTLNYLQVRGAKVFCGGCALKLNYYNLKLSDERF